ncbi:MAG: putative methylase [Candidatus Methanomethylophilaceae archaeon]|nr:putative methylase [Candidatus Methanomethylophilaceae archaeon]MDI3541107.1 putative methylase [Candidatus Methanomethylophilaceae archaeon]HIJ00558.1 methyltransferase [Candidatus Methanomethylophilaceae archaeon]
MKLRELEIALERVPTFKEPSAVLEQYQTPAPIAADMLYTAAGQGSISGKEVIDLGCGTGVLSVGSWLMGASDVTGVDISDKALSQAREYCADIGADIKFVKADVRDFDGHADTVIMNPPFGCQTRNADRVFLTKALEIADEIYSLHMRETLPFLERLLSSLEREVWFHKEYKYDIPHLFNFHRRPKKAVDIIMIAIR